MLQVWIRNKDTKGHSPEALDQELPYQILSCGVLGGVVPIAKKNTKHRRVETRDGWMIVCAEDLMITRSDFSFTYCPNCGEEL